MGEGNWQNLPLLHWISRRTPLIWYFLVPKTNLPEWQGKKIRNTRHFLGIPADKLYLKGRISCLLLQLQLRYYITGWPPMCIARVLKEFIHHFFFTLTGLIYWSKCSSSDCFTHFWTERPSIYNCILVCDYLRIHFIKCIQGNLQIRTDRFRILLLVCIMLHIWSALTHLILNSKPNSFPHHTEVFWTQSGQYWPQCLCPWAWNRNVLNVKSFGTFSTRSELLI